MKFTERLNSHLTPEWRTQYIDYEELKEHLYRYVQDLELLHYSTNEEVKIYLDECDDEFFRLCQNALNKIDTFFAEKIAEACRKYSKLVEDLDDYLESVHSKSIIWMSGSRASLPRKRTESVMRDNERLRTSENGGLNSIASSHIENLRKFSSEDSEIRNRRKFSRSSDEFKSSTKSKKKKKHFRKLHDLKLAFSEFYLSLVLLQNYQSLNFTGFRKILKKHDKLLHRTTGLVWRQQIVEPAPFNTSRKVDDLITEVENLFTEKLEQGDRQKAMKRLRVPPLAEHYNPPAVFLFGLFAGIFFVQVVVIALTCGILLTTLGLAVISLPS